MYLNLPRKFKCKSIIELVYKDVNESTAKRDKVSDESAIYSPKSKYLLS